MPTIERRLTPRVVNRSCRLPSVFVESNDPSSKRPCSVDTTPPNPTFCEHCFRNICRIDCVPVNLDMWIQCLKEHFQHEGSPPNAVLDSVLVGDSRIRGHRPGEVEPPGGDRRAHIMTSVYKNPSGPERGSCASWLDSIVGAHAARAGPLRHSPTQAPRKDLACTGSTLTLHIDIDN